MEQSYGFDGNRSDFGFESMAFLHLVSELRVLLLEIKCKPIDALIFGPTVDGVFVARNLRSQGRGTYSNNDSSDAMYNEPLSSISTTSTAIG